jgi:hypothetical protein
VPFSVFCEWMRDAGDWTADTDTQLVRHLNALSDAPGATPWHLRYCEVLPPDPAQCPELSRIRLPRIRARAAVLRLVNDLLQAPVLPLVDLGGHEIGGGRPWSPGHALARHRDLIFSCCKGELLGRLLEATTAPLTKHLEWCACVSLSLSLSRPPARTHTKRAQCTQSA